MFGKKKEAKVKELSQGKELMSERAKVQRERGELSNRIMNEVEQLTLGQRLIYKLPEFFWSGFAAFLITELNPDYPEKDKKKYICYADKMGDGKPAGQKLNVWKSNNPKGLADWISDRNCYGSIERFQE